MSNSTVDYLMERMKAYSEKRKAEKNRARRIIVFFAGDSFGDFVHQNVVAAALTKPLHASVLAVFKNHPPYREFITECNPYIHAEIKADRDADVTIPIDWFDIGVSAPIKCPEPVWKERQFGEPDLVLLPGMLRADAARLLGLAEAPPLFRIPPEHEKPLLRTLEQRGLAPDKWFACLHLNEAAETESYLPVIRHITEKQGGRVAVIGRPEAATLPEMKGVIDLRQIPDSLPEQAAAISSARYFIGGDCGPTALASAFITPCAVVNARRFADRVWNKGDVVLAKKIIGPEGRVLGTREAYDEGYLDNPLTETPEYRDNTPEELIAVSDHIYELTSGCNGWRPKADEIAAEKSARLTFPFPMRDEPLVTFWK